MMKKTRLTAILLAATLLSATAVCATGCGSQSDSTEETTVATTTVAVEETTTEAAEEVEASSADVEVLGDGATVFYFDVVDADAVETDFEIHTDATTVGEALLDLDLIAGEDGDYGLYVKTVNGVTVDYDTDGKYWAFYIDGEYASTGVDSTNVQAGSTYAFKVE